MFYLEFTPKNQLSVIIKPEPDLLTRGQNDEVNFMTLFMNEKDMNEMLDSICPEGETYQGKAWGTLNPDVRNSRNAGSGGLK